MANGLVLVSHLASCFPKRFKVSLSNPVPTLPAYTSFRVVVTDEQSSEPYAVALGLGISSNHKFLLSGALELEPVARSPRDVHTIGPFAHDPFPAFAAGFLVVGLAFGFAVLGKSDRVPEIERLLQQLFPVTQRKLARIVALEVYQVEGINPDRNSATKFL